MNLIDWFYKGLTIEQYIDSMNVNKEKLLHIKQNYLLHATDEIHSLQELHLKAIVITADWCGDAMVNIPILLRIAEATNIDVRFILRDSNLELMDQYLTNGTARSIPIFIFIDGKGNELAVWGPRAAKIQESFDELKAQLPSVEAPDFKEKQLEMFKEFVNKFTVDHDIWHVIADSIISKLKEIK